MKEETVEQSSLSKFVYNLIYPAILGSILYSLLPTASDLNYLVGVGIFIFYMLDYIHLYFKMENKFTQDQKNEKTYILFDLLVSVLLFIAFQYYKVNPMLAIILLAFIPLCFLVYSKPLNYNILFYRLFFSATLLFAVIFTVNFYHKTGFINLKNDLALLILIFGMNLIYLIYVIYQLTINHKTEKEELN